MTSQAHSSEHRLVWLTQRLADFGRPYMITGSQAAYEYHRWLAPLENLVTLQVYSADLFAWRGMAGDGCVVFEAPPTIAQVQAVYEVIILDPTLNPERHGRRRMIADLAFVAPEDLCLDLIERARGETSPAEAAAILIAQRDVLTWDLLLEQARQRRLARQLGALIEAANGELGMDIAPSGFLIELHQLAVTQETPGEKKGYPVGRRQVVPPEYASLAEHWGIHWVLPRQVIGKVALDLAPRLRLTVPPLRG